MQTFESLTVADSVQVLSEKFYEQGNIKFNKALITVETAALRFLITGTPPSTTLGHLASAGDTIELESHDEIKKFKAIRTTGTSAVIMVTYRVKDE